MPVKQFSQAQSVHAYLPNFPILPACVTQWIHLSAHKVLPIFQPGAAIITLLSSHLGSPWRPCPQQTAWGPGGRAGSWGPCNVARASLIRATWKLGDFDTSCFQRSTRRTEQRHRQRGRVYVCVCVAAKTSGPAFLKPHWVCSEEGPTPAHRLTTTKEGRENARGRGRAPGGGGEGHKRSWDHTRAA